MDFKRLRYFCAVVEHGSLTKAAQALHIAQPPLSRRLRELEEEIGVALFNRDGRTITPTDAGKHLYQRAGDILRDIEAAAQETRMMAGQTQRILRIGLSHLYQHYFSPLLLELHRRNPRLEVSLSVCDSSQLEFLLDSKKIDIALMQRPHKSDPFVCLDLPAPKNIAVVSEHISMCPPGPYLPLTVLGHMPLVLLHRATGSGTYEVLTEKFRRIGIEANVIMQISQPGVIIDWMEDGLSAAALLPGSEVSADGVRHCRVYEVTDAPRMFSPAVVRRTLQPPVPEIEALISGGFLPDQIG